MSKEGFKKHSIWIRDGYEEQVQGAFKGIERYAQLELADRDWLEEMLEPTKQTPITSVLLARTINGIVCEYDDTFKVGSLLLWRNNNQKFYRSPELSKLDRPPKEWQDFVMGLSTREKSAIGTSISSIGGALSRAKHGVALDMRGLESITMEQARSLEGIVEERDDMQFYKEEIFAAVAFRRQKS